MEKPVTVTLAPWEAAAVKTLMRREARRKRREVERSDFVPAPGYKNMSLVRAETYEAILRKIEVAQVIR